MTRGALATAAADMLLVCARVQFAVSLRAVPFPAECPGAIGWVTSDSARIEGIANG
jgi:hypothetical protein